MSFSRAIIKFHGINRGLTNYRFLTTATHNNALSCIGRQTLSRQFPCLGSASISQLLYSSARNFSVSTERYSERITSSDTSKSNENFFIPEPPQPPTVEETGTDLLLNHLGEPTFNSLGIGTSYFPSDFILKFLEQLHVTGELPWWGVLGVSTIVVRCAIFPLIINFRRKSANFANHMPTLRKLQSRLDTARLQNNMLEMSRISNEMHSFIDRNEVVSVKSMFLFPVLNGAIIISFLSAIRTMANYPIASMQTGGLFWFTDLTLPDTYCILPLTCVASMYVIMEIGADMTKTSSQSKAMRYGLRGLPVVVFFFMMNMPAAVTYYFTVSNFFSIIQTAALKTTKIRNYFNIPVEVQHPKETSTETTVTEKKGFWEEFRQSKRRAEMLRLVSERERLDDKQFREAGKALVKKTLPVKPTRSSNNNSEKELRRA